MAAVFQMTWMTLIGLSLLFVGGFVLWVYGKQTPHAAITIKGPEMEAIHHFYSHHVRWFFLYGMMCVILGASCLIITTLKIV